MRTIIIKITNAELNVGLIRHPQPNVQKDRSTNQGHSTVEHKKRRDTKIPNRLTTSL